MSKHSMTRPELVTVIRSTRKSYCTVAVARRESRYLSNETDKLGREVADLMAVLEYRDRMFAQAKMDHEERV